MFSICQPDDAAATAAALTDAFTGDPLMRFLFADRERHGGQVERMMTVAAENGINTGHGYHWSEHGEVLGAALWAPPGRPFYSPGGQERLGDLIASADPARADLVFGGLGQLAGHRPEQPSFYLHLFGVKASARGRGIGAELLGGVLELVDRLGRPAHLESTNPRNVSIYERHGFEVVAEVTMPEGGPTVRPMFRPAR